MTALAGVGDERSEVEGADVLGEMQHVGMVGLVRLDGVRVVVDTGNDLGTGNAVETCLLDAGGCATSSTEKVDIEEFHFIHFRLVLTYSHP